MGTTRGVHLFCIRILLINCRIDLQTPDLWWHFGAVTRSLGPGILTLYSLVVITAATGMSYVCCVSVITAAIGMSYVCRVIDCWRYAPSSYYLWLCEDERNWCEWRVINFRDWFITKEDKFLWSILVKLQPTAPPLLSLMVDTSCPSSP